MLILKYQGIVQKVSFLSHFFDFSGNLDANNEVKERVQIVEKRRREETRCCIFQPEIGYCTLQKMVENCLSNVYRAKKLKIEETARKLLQNLAKNCLGAFITYTDTFYHIH